MIHAHRSTAHVGRRSILALVLALPIAAAACASTAGTAIPTVPAAIQSAAASLAGGGSSAAACRDLQNLKSLDYAFGASFSVVQALDAASKAKTLTDLQAFVAEAPAEVQPAAADLLAFWTALSTDPNSVTESDPRLVSATQALGAWLAANCA